MVLDAFAYSLPISILDFAVCYVVCRLYTSNRICKELTSLTRLDIIGHVERNMIMPFEFVRFVAKVITSDIKTLWEFFKELYKDDGGKISLVLAIIAIAFGLIIVFTFPRAVLFGIFIAWRLCKADEDYTDDE